MRSMTAIMLLLLILATGSAVGGECEFSNSGKEIHYEGTSTCLECHKSDAENFFHSQHYQWQGESPDIVNSNGQRLGKMNTLNDFCTNPAANWIGTVKNSDGNKLANGCSACHAGLGKMPQAEMTDEQLENIDCLICHASGYRRSLSQNKETQEWEWKPILLGRNQRGMDSIAKRISLPTRKMCLRCHSAAGGGPNFKRGDIEYEMVECDDNFDVHMSVEGNDMDCIECHAGTDHRVRGRGSDLAGTDIPGDRLTCLECHDEAPHAVKVLDHHVNRVDCTVCHIPVFAKSDPTDMVRDWSTPKRHEEANKYSATITFESNVVPDYQWWNGKTWHQKMGEKAKPRKDGTYGIMVPEGSRKDKSAKIHAFKLHKGKLPRLKKEGYLVPMAVEEFFRDGDIDVAVEEGAHAAYGIEHPDYEWVDTVRWMGIFHEVQPASNALTCLDCHSPNGRMNWEALGYKEDPLEKLID